ncbi:3-hydroxybutyryl-CoA dehydrogenase [Thermobaculum terrenum ATCC BAA-798]|uniref:3-hydroxybutyryl-CoA dehydrogenase n=1 Tax=Thermobaculum terrenum (strain ATCC BAA-798 / CCMEE 7001 / YNP1) TaxID=525904 RepID=D1CCR2_THET1|nr:3-hydroxybutyryl-CoA dehydrogenase [Thermobaculum terrenum]ACZ42577.1 3-hydroxybutyryl-CoA dehydrogenase [Thermobaculum terrenum ATCC BAA-798]
MADIVVVGAGTMGRGIAQVFAQAGDKVYLVEVDPRQLSLGLETISENLEKSVQKGRITPEQKQSVLSNIVALPDIRQVPSADLLIEAIYENVEAKLELFSLADELFPSDTIFASNTSSISITRLAASTSREDRFIGMHFFNPVPVMKLVEVVRGLKTSDETCQKIIDEARRLGKEPVVVRDFPGFVSNRVLMPMINEAIFALYEGVASRDDIDKVMKLGMNHPMGPLELADFIGLDVCLYILDVLYEGFRDPKYRPCPLLRQMVAAGKLGRKTGSGFYDYL